MPRFDESFNGLCKQNLEDTQQLKQRYLDAKAKRVSKNKDKKQQEPIHNSMHVQQKFMKKTEEHEPGSLSDSYEPPVKLHCTTHHGSQSAEGLTKFSVEIVQQLEFTTSAANSKPQQISTNVTVKTHTNASVKSDILSPKSETCNSTSNVELNSNIDLDVGGLSGCVKQEPDHDFADLDQCAAAVEKDVAANGGTGFSGLDFINDTTNAQMLNFDDFLSDLNYPDFMLDLENKTQTNNLKVKDDKDAVQTNPDTNKNVQNLLSQNQSNYSSSTHDDGFSKSRIYPNLEFSKTELSPAAQTLKQMAEHHQHKNQASLPYPGARSSNSRSPYSDFHFQNEYNIPNTSSNFHKNTSSFTQSDIVKQEMLFQTNDYETSRKGPTSYKQQYSPFNNSSATNHNSSNYIPRPAQSNGTSQSGSYSSGTPPRPPSVHTDNSSNNLQINQAQQILINHQNRGNAIQVSAGQQMYLSGDLKGNLSIASQQGMHLKQHNMSHANPQNTQSVSLGQLEPQGIPNSHSFPQMGAHRMRFNSLQGNIQGSINDQNISGSSVLNGVPIPHASSLSGNYANTQNDCYSVSQSQTINFTQQSLRQRGSVPMIRPHVPFSQQHMSMRNMYPGQQTSAADAINQQSGGDWKHMMLTQQQNANFNMPHMMQTNLQPGFNMNCSNVQLPNIRSQPNMMTGNMMPSQQGVRQNQIIETGNMSQPNNQHLLREMHQQNLMQTHPQMNMTSLHMQQNQSISIANQDPQRQIGLGNQHVNNAFNNNQSSHSINTFNSQAGDINLEFLDNLHSEGALIPDSDLLSSFDNGTGFI